MGIAYISYNINPLYPFYPWDRREPSKEARPSRSVVTCICGWPIILYWIRDEVWQAAATAATGPGGHLCLDCAAKAIGRPLTLHDLAVSNYLRTSQHNNLDFMRRYTQATIIGALNETGTPIPENWAKPTVQPHLDAMKIGEHLARQTSNPKAILLGLAAEVDRCFPTPWAT